MYEAKSNHWATLKNEGYYIHTSSGTFNQKAVPTCYEVCKETSLTSRTVICLVNKAARDKLINEFGYQEQKQEQESVWLTRPDHLDIAYDTEPMILFWTNSASQEQNILATP